MYKKNKIVAFLLAFFLGGIGLHRFYLGNIVLGILYLAFCWTFVPVIISLFDSLILLVMSDKNFDKKYNI